MPWDGSTNAGFSVGTPWLPLNSDWPVRNVACQTEDASSILTLHRRLLAARRTHSALSAGGMRLLDVMGNVLAYERWHGRERLIVALNLGASPQDLILPEWASAFRSILSTVDDRVSIGSGALSLRADEGVILTAD
jgi:alpha-glucosidase